MLYEIVFDCFPLEICRAGKELFLQERDYMRFYSMAPEMCDSYGMPSYMRLVYELCLRCLHC